jgi:hypothetical protein
MPNCNHSLVRPYRFVGDNEMLRNFCDMKMDRNIYQFFIDLFKGDKFICFTGSILPCSTMLCGNRVLPVAFYYMYPIAYQINGDGVREITVSYIDWREKIYAECVYLFYLYPKRTGTREYSYNIRIEFKIRHITAKRRETNTNRIQRIIHATGDQLVQWILELLHESDEKIERVCLQETGVLLSRRLVDFLKYMCLIYGSVRDYMRKNSRCNGPVDGTCICVALCTGVRSLYENVNQISGAAVLREAKK